MIVYKNNYGFQHNTGSIWKHKELEAIIIYHWMIDNVPICSLLRNSDTFKRQKVE